MKRPVSIADLGHTVCYDPLIPVNRRTFYLAVVH
jgi:hypothetical protein